MMPCNRFIHLINDNFPLMFPACQHVTKENKPERFEGGLKAYGHPHEKEVPRAIEPSRICCTHCRCCCLEQDWQQNPNPSLEVQNIEKYCNIILQLSTNIAKLRTKYHSNNFQHIIKAWANNQTSGAHIWKTTPFVLTSQTPIPETQTFCRSTKITVSMSSRNPNLAETKEFTGTKRRLKGNKNRMKGFKVRETEYAKRSVIVVTTRAQDWSTIAVETNGEGVVTMTVRTQEWSAITVKTNGEGTVAVVEQGHNSEGVRELEAFRVRVHREWGCESEKFSAILQLNDGFV